MAVRESHALPCAPVHLRRGDIAALGIVRVHVAIAQIIREDDDKVRLRRSSSDGLAATDRCEDHHNDEAFHACQGHGHFISVTVIFRRQSESTL
jgi:hypothetical protein